MKSIAKSVLTLTIAAFLGNGQVAKKADEPPVLGPPGANRAAEPDAGAISLKMAMESTAGDYTIGPGDVLEINIWKEPDASVPSATVRSDGKISVPFVKDVQAAGLTPIALEAVLSYRLRAFIRDPRITVMVKEANSKKIYVIGEVNKEGAIRLQAPMTVLQAIAEAGGITDYAKKSRIQLIRIEDGKQKVYRFDYSAIVRGEHLEQNFQVQPGDTIVVPR